MARALQSKSRHTFTGAGISRSVAVGFVFLMASSMIRVDSAVASTSGLSLPSTFVTMEVFNGTTGYFNTSLSDIASGYAVTNGTYPGWCIDRTAEMTRSPAIHQVQLYSSIEPPGDLASQSWDLINYILNHEQGNAEDIQQAMWYFIHMDTNYTPESPTAWTIIHDAEANGTGFVPRIGQTIAIICYPIVLFPQPNPIQVSIVELTVPFFELVADVTGPEGQPDGRVDLRDIAMIARHFGETVPPASSDLDIVEDAKIDMKDIGTAAKSFGDHYP